MPLRVKKKRELDRKRRAVGRILAFLNSRQWYLRRLTVKDKTRQRYDAVSDKFFATTSLDETAPAALIDRELDR